MTSKEILEKSYTGDNCLGQTYELTKEELEQLKSIWCKKQRENCSEEINGYVCRLCKESINLVLNAPKPDLI